MIEVTIVEQSGSALIVLDEAGSTKMLVMYPKNQSGNGRQGDANEREFIGWAYMPDRPGSGGALTPTEQITATIIRHGAGALTLHYTTGSAIRRLFGIVTDNDGKHDGKTQYQMELMHTT